MLSTPCHDAFQAAQAFRQSVPLSAGAYKIREAVTQLARMGQCVSAVGDKIRRGEKFRYDEDLYGCLGHERGGYLKAMPKTIADTLGRMILPGIAELAADGVPTSEVARAYRQAERDVQALLRDCEEVNALLQRGVRHEYAAMGQGGSHLQDLVRRAEAIGRHALDLVDAHKTAA